MLKILITGASGFVGANLIERLSRKHVVYGLVRNKRDFHCHTSVNVIEADLHNKDFVKSLPPDINVVVHLAQSPRYREFPDGAEDMIAINLHSTFMLLEWARKSKVQKFIFTSTANVYSQKDELLTEQCNTGPNSFYGATKLASEQLLVQYSQYFNIDILRVFTVYGPNQKNTLIPQIIDKIKCNKEIILASSIGIRITPIYIDDLVEVICKIICLNEQDKINILNACGDEEVTLAEIVIILEELLGINALTRIPNDNPYCFIGSNAVLHEKLGSFKFTSLVTGLRNTVES